MQPRLTRLKQCKLTTRNFPLTNVNPTKDAVELDKEKAMKTARLIDELEKDLVHPMVRNPKKIQHKWKDNDMRLHFEILSYMNYIRASASEKRARFAIFSTLRHRIKKAFKGQVQLTIYGSIATGLELPTTDLDLSMEIQTNRQGRKGQLQVLYKLRSVLQNSGSIQDVQPRFGARVPILRGITSKNLGCIGVDITVNHEDGPKCVKAIRRYLLQMPALRPLIFVLKSLLSYRNLNDAAERGLSSYSLTCMCISFLQLNPKNRPKEWIENPYKAKSLGILLRDFLEYYAVEFPYAESYISVLQGRLLPKASVDWIQKENADLLAIECLVKHRNDVARATNRIPAIREAFKSASETLLQTSLKDKTTLGSIIPFKGLGARRPEVFPDLVISSQRLPSSASMDRLSTDKEGQQHSPSFHKLAITAREENEGKKTPKTKTQPPDRTALQKNVNVSSSTSSSQI
ncbi:hypothetical protein E1B28_006484 [Marasmius oreades]|uniref:polynucleotide adenylyltransferase n=1 Tax=Marasmius oreades TaxID=181124 RepID=A0A9P7S7L0_9AGAR|nr:uncharacterized protein E1B28_006484 [Marasmius oreades]KAG7095781.1 hypothetical protein E1B28_006484 [Marasmius oreades]